MSLRFRATVDDAPSARFAAAAARGEDLRPALRAISAAGVAQTKKRFVTKRAPDGSTWKVTDKATGSTLIESALLLRSIAAQPPSDTAVEWGSNRVYAAVHQAGIDRNVTVRAHERQANHIFGRRLNRPVRFTVSAHSRQMVVVARPYLGVNDQDMAEFGQIALRHVGEPLTGGR